MLFGVADAEGHCLTARVVTGRQQDATSSLSLPDDVTRSWGTQNAVLTDDELLDAVRGRDLCDDLGDLWVPVAAITTNDEGAAFITFWNGQNDSRNKVLGVVGLLEDLDLLAQARAIAS